MDRKTGHTIAEQTEGQARRGRGRMVAGIEAETAGESEQVERPSRPAVSIDQIAEELGYGR